MASPWCGSVSSALFPRQRHCLRCISTVTWNLVYIYIYIYIYMYMNTTDYIDDNGVVGSCRRAVALRSHIRHVITSTILATPCLCNSGSLLFFTTPCAAIIEVVIWPCTRLNRPTACATLKQHPQDTWTNAVYIYMWYTYIIRGACYMIHLRIMIVIHNANKNNDMHAFTMYDAS